ncbi:alpha/beta hydrolase fold protein [Natronomonas moolapensis 8.8.11]|uniref:Alpha/beta hydrolase fold protein n=1 Tax=Natronomonas moolapensis (strain DSM 18674 / CECT 7526 / JCM 14361 / 8.8.11) TaxID=268739 RepID=M1XMX1_NATM8|nr:alpha/beta hydrolase [Natronomonas moolapensis]CCQ35219.1 alpha/beta hydrolase fold protein [Natronomonas moolapensis 8.8.11]
MPTVTEGGATLRYECSGGNDRPAVAFLPDVGFGPWVWGWQAPKLAGPYRTVVHAMRGTDGSEASGPYTVDRFAADVEAVLADAGIRRVHLVGAGLGGMVALRHASEYGRARSLSLLGVAASGSRVDKAALSALHPADPAALESSLSAAFTQQFLTETDLIGRITTWRREEDATGEALSGHCEAALGFEAGALYELSLPALVCHGVDDPVVPSAAGEKLADGLPNGHFEAVEGKRCCYVEHAAAVADAIDGFVDGVVASGE